MKNIPELRFPEFKGEWEEKKLGEIAKFSKGKGIPKKDISEDGEHLCIRYGELYTDYTEVIDEVISRTDLDIENLVLSEKNDVIIPSSGETHIDIATASCVTHSGIALGGDLNIIKTKLDGIFLAYYLNNTKKRDIAKFAQGSSVIHLYESGLRLLKIAVPALPEQEKIASFLTSVDERISLLKEKEVALELYKKGLMQQLFSQELRFKDDTGNDFPDWEEKRLGEIGKTFNGLSGKTKEDFDKGRSWYIQYKQIFDNSKIDITGFGKVEVSANENQNKVNYGDVLFTVSSETAHEVGMSSILLDEVDNLYLNSFSFGIKLKSQEKTIPYYLRQYFRSELFRRKTFKLAQGSTRYNLSKVAFMKLKIQIPSPAEQEKIASFLGSIDDKIALVQQELVHLEDWKRGLLQQLFV